MTKRRRKPASPDDIAAYMRQQREQQDRADDVALLERQPDVQIATLPKQPHRRHDVFDQLFYALKPALSFAEHAAARRLATDYAESMGEADRGSGMERIDGPCSGSAVYRRIAARERMSVVLEGYPVDGMIVTPGVGVFYARMLMHLIVPSELPWRAIMLVETGEASERVQTALVRQACRSLAQAYAEVDNCARKRA